MTMYDSHDEVAAFRAEFVAYRLSFFLKIAP